MNKCLKPYINEETLNTSFSVFNIPTYLKIRKIYSYLKQSIITKTDISRHSSLKYLFLYNIKTNVFYKVQDINIKKDQNIILENDTFTFVYKTVNDHDILYQKLQLINSNELSYDPMIVLHYGTDSDNYQGIY